MKMNLLNSRLSFIIFFILIVFNIDSSNLDNLCNNLLKEYGEFGFIITNPQNGQIEITYNDNMILYKKFYPGSLLKPFALIAVSKTSKINYLEMHDCNGDPDNEFACWLHKGHGKLNLINAIAHSCNYYFYYFLKNKLNKKAYIDTLKDFNIYYKDDDFNLNKDDFIKSSFGLGEKYSVYPVDIIFAYNSIFNNGIIYNKEGKKIRNNKINNELVDIISQGMRESYLYGTSNYILGKTGIVDILAKTGTGPNNDKMKNIWNNNTGWIVILSPSFNPDFSILVITRVGGSSNACKVAAELLNYFKER